MARHGGEDAGLRCSCHWRPLGPERRLTCPVEVEDRDRDPELPDRVEQSPFLPAGVIGAAQGDQDVIRPEVPDRVGEAVNGVSSPIWPRTSASA